MSPDDDLTLEPQNAVTAGAATAPAPFRTTTRFAPGAIVAGRYRLVALLGRGGMGEVYRADDLTLDQPVALKFLAEGIATSDARLAQFHNELRTARQVSHKNVCRLYDLGETDGRRFLTMEYVDGEDLSVSLRRFGRMPPDKAVQIARQLCAGISAAHERGVLHRDLKPANVMLDGNGDVRITDFGIATAAADVGAEIAGTPQYMAPEQLAGRPASIKSDIYALGLILFEVFTGKRAYDAKTIAGLKEIHETGTVTTPSTIVPDLDPAVERVILRCLDKDPDRRPASALTVAAALPGGDPLAAALAAGETPSPDMLAAAAETGALAVHWGLAAVATIVAGFLIFAGLSSRTSHVGRLRLAKEPAVLLDRAEQILSSLGYTTGAGDRAYGLMPARDYLQWLWQTRRTPQRWDPISNGNPSALLLWYRTSPRDLLPTIGEAVALNDPPVTETDMRLLVTDMQGRLREFRSVTPQLDASKAPDDEPRWEVLFGAAGLNMSSFSPVAPEWTPRDYATARAAWEGPLSGQSDLRVRVEAAAYRGRLVSFSMIGPWTRPTLMQPRQMSRVDRWLNGAISIAFVLLMTTAMLLARRHLRSGRADRRGAAGLAAFMGVAGLVRWLVGGTHTSDMYVEIELLIRSAGSTALIVLLMWAVYLALEPYVRRFWPDSLLGWSRLTAGHVRDPRVGTDLLIGAVCGVGLSFIDLVRGRIFQILGYAPPAPTHGVRSDVLAGPAWLFSLLIGWSARALIVALVAVLLFVVLRLLLRRVWVSVVVGALLLSLTAMNNAGTAGSALIWFFPLAAGSFLALILVRFGLLAFAVSVFVWSVMTAVPLTLEMTQWWAVPSNWALACVTALALFGFYASRAGQPLFGRVLSD